MSNKAYFSPSKLIFIPFEWGPVDSGGDGTWSAEKMPLDIVLLDEEQYSAYWKVSPPEGKQLGAVNGLPAWVDAPPLTKEQLTSLAEQKKSELRAVADYAILPLQDAVALSMATEDEKKALIAWTTYRVLLNRVDTAIAPDITWPPLPV